MGSSSSLDIIDNYPRYFYDPGGGGDPVEMGANQDPEGHFVQNLHDTMTLRTNLDGAQLYIFFGKDYDTVYPGANGLISFNFPSAGMSSCAWATSVPVGIQLYLSQRSSVYAQRHHPCALPVAGSHRPAGQGCGRGNNTCGFITVTHRRLSVMC